MKPAGSRSLRSVDTYDEPQDGLEAELRILAARRAGERRPDVPARRTRTRGWALRRALVAADLGGLCLALVLTQLLAVRVVEPQELAVNGLLLLGFPGWVVLAQMYGLYDHVEIGVARSTADDVPGLLLLSSFTAWVGLLLVNASGLAQPRLGIATTFWLAAIGLIIAGRVAARWFVQRRDDLREPTLIIGTDRVALRIARMLAARPEYGLDVVGFVDDEALEAPENLPPYLGSATELERLVRAYEVERVIVAFSRASADAHVDLLRRCADLRVRVEVVPRMYEVIGSRTWVHDLGGIPLVSLSPARLSRAARLVKRSFDLLVGGFALLVFTPFIAFAAWRIKAGSPGPVFFRQERMGAGGRRFQMFKFRTMSFDADERKHEVAHMNKHAEDGPRMFKVTDDPRITTFGRFLRSWSLDELPQLFNVLRGEMSLVGPRPLILDEDENILGHHRRRLHLTPGLTGLWQVLGRSDLPFSEMVTLDYVYVTNWSLWGDIKLLARTVPAIISKRGAY
jgi:exopolysaccharide biosynthesis polyprenyl glycosylphosphotransferase